MDLACFGGRDAEAPMIGRGKMSSFFSNTDNGIAPAQRSTLPNGRNRDEEVERRFLPHLRENAQA